MSTFTAKCRSTGDNNTEIPRGAIPDTRTEQMGYSIFNKSEVWSDLCAGLYEDAIADRWNSSADIPWDTLAPIGSDLERAVCQIATLMSEYGWTKAQTTGRWLQGNLIWLHRGQAVPWYGRV